jgi:nitrogen fixation/metabolism regulation signal transduction histidine kinase
MPAKPHLSTAARWAWMLSLLGVATASGVLAYLLSIGATTPRGFIERHQAWLFWVNMGVGAVLGLVVLGAALRLSLRVQRGRFGAQLLGRMALVFAAVALIPGLLIYTVSASFVNRSVESWFDIRLAAALEAGLNLGRATLDVKVDELAAQARQGAQTVADLGGGSPALTLERLREQLRAERVALVSANGQVLIEVVDTTTANVSPVLQPRERMDTTLIQRASRDGTAARLEGLDDEAAALAGAVRIRAFARVPATDFKLTEGERYLLVVHAPPTSLIANALAVQNASQEYQRRALERAGLRQMYLGTLTLVLVLAVFIALLLAIQLGNRLAKPLLLLADGMRQVAAGDLTRKPVSGSRDELGGLTRAFADMTDQLGQAREQAQGSLAALERARARLQTLLDNLTAGVMVFDGAQRLVSVNASATRILRQPVADLVGLPLDQRPGLAEFAQLIWPRYATLMGGADDRHSAEHWQLATDLALPGLSNPLTLLLRGAQLPDGQWLLVFDDISEVASAQRTQAWGEVARRLAHEIKNPLTPIQLSAERLEHKLATKLPDDADRSLLRRCVGTIVDQVQAMKQLVNEFRDYARLPAAQLAPLNLNALVVDVVALYPDAQDQGRLLWQPEAALPDILGDASQLRQVIHNLVQNALDAVSDRPDGRVVVDTKQSRHEDGRIRAVRLTLTDNGPGFAEHVLTRAFEPYVTTKSKGTGLGLAVVKKIADEHGATIRLSNLAGPDGTSPAGARVTFTFAQLAA